MASTKRLVSTRVTGHTPSSNVSTKTGCGGLSSSCPSWVPMVNQPPAIGAKPEDIGERESSIARS